MWLTQIKATYLACQFVIGFYVFDWTNSYFIKTILVIYGYIVYACSHDIFGETFGVSPLAKGANLHVDAVELNGCGIIASRLISTIAIDLSLIHISEPTRRS